jgi:hypothetical protein
VGGRGAKEGRGGSGARSGEVMGGLGLGVAVAEVVGAGQKGSKQACHAAGQ